MPLTTKRPRWFVTRPMNPECITGRIARRLVVGLSALAVTSCAPSLTAMREREPIRSWSAAAAPTAVLDCLQVQLDRESGLAMFNPKANLRTQREAHEGGVVVLIARGSMNNAIEFIVTARPEGAGSHVELRTWADWPRVIVPVIERCTGAQGNR